jgi:hypothetical protein
MNGDAAKRAVSFGVFGLGMLGGLWSCSRYTRAVIISGNNDSFAEFLALTLAFASPLPACVVALWRRIEAGIWLIVAGCFLPVGMLLQHAFVTYVRQFADQGTAWQTILDFLPYSGVLIALGSFGLVTGLRKWPKLL